MAEIQIGTPLAEVSSEGWEQCGSDLKTNAPLLNVLGAAGHDVADVSERLQAQAPQQAPEPEADVSEVTPNTPSGPQFS